MCMAGGFVLGEVLALLPVNVGTGILVILVPGFLWLCKKGRSSRKPWEWFLLFLCCVSGFAAMYRYSQDGMESEVIRSAEGKRVWVAGHVVQIGEKERSYGLTLSGCRAELDDWALGRVIGIEAGRKITYEMPDMVVYVEKEKFERVNEKQTVRLGMEVAVWGELKEMTGARNPGEFDFREYYRAQGIRAQMFGQDMEIRDSSYWRYRDLLFRMRMAAGEVLARICEPEDLGIFQAAILGDKTELDDGVRRLYQRNGIAHLLAISGLHISLVGMFVYRILRRAGMGYGVSGLIGAAVIVSYGVLTGGSSSVVRAVLMILVMILAGYLGKSYDMLSAAGLACLLILLESPGLVTQAGFQLSFGAVAAIGGLGPWMVNRLEVKSGFGKTVALGAAVQIVTCPVIVYHFFQYPVYGIALNLVVIPLMGYVVVSGILGIVLGAVWQPAGVAAVGSGHYILEFYRWLCLLAEKLPGANLVVGRPRLWQVAVYAAVVGVALWYAGRRQGMAGRREMTGRREVAVPRRMVLAAGTVLGFLMLWPLPVTGMEATFLDVGQGDGICIRSRDAVILVDGGSTDKKELGKNTMEPYLKSRGICQVDYVVVSHGDRDHISGIQYLLEENSGIRVKNLVLPWLGREDESYEPLVRLMEAHGGRIHWMQAGEQIKAGGLSLTCLYHGSEKRKQEKNEHSLVLALQYGQTGILLTGDMSEAGEKDMIAGKGLPLYDTHFDVLKAAHHGSKYSSCEPFLDWIAPTWTVISCGEGNSYGHPHKETVERLENQGTEILMTGNAGAIIMHSDKKTITYSTFISVD